MKNSFEKRAQTNISARAALHIGVRGVQRGRQRLMNATMDYDPKYTSDINFERHSFFAHQNRSLFMKKNFRFCDNIGHV